MLAELLGVVSCTFPAKIDLACSAAQRRVDSKSLPTATITPPYPGVSRSLRIFFQLAKFILHRLLHANLDHHIAFIIVTKNRHDILKAANAKRNEVLALDTEE